MLLIYQLKNGLLHRIQIQAIRVGKEIGTKNTR